MSIRNFAGGAMLCALLVGGGAIVAGVAGSDTTVHAQRGKSKTAAKQDLRALKRQIAADNLKTIEKYIKDNSSAEDIGDAYLLAVNTAVDAKDLNSVRKHAKAFTDKHKEHANTGAVLEAAAKAELNIGTDMKAGAKAVEAAVPHLDLRGKVDLMIELADTQAISGDVEGAKGTYDKILEMPEISGNARNKSHFEGQKAKLDDLGKDFDHFEVTGFDGKPLNSKDYKGKYVFIDFWATWCGPCIEEMPNVIANYKRFNEKGFDVIGISLDNAERDGEAKLKEYIEKNKMPWRQYYDGKFWQTELATKYGVRSIPHTILLDKEGKVLAIGLRGEKLGNVLEKLLGDE